jgi:glutamate synthase (NADPH/NADH) small chain
MGQHGLTLAQLQDSFSETHPRYTKNEATVEAERCLYCFDAPCIKACPTSIDIPTFIRQIANDNLTGAGTTILEANMMGHTCGRVCPVDELCVGACVLGAEHRPIAIGRLQRYATDHIFDNDIDVFQAAPSSGKRVAIIGAGPAGLSAAGELARRGIQAVVFEKQELAGGLSTYGIVVMREPTAVALEEVEFVKKLGVEVRTGVEVGKDVSAQQLLSDYDAVVFAAGTGRVPALGVPGEQLQGVIEALPYIAATKIADKDDTALLYDLPTGNEVIVVGAGNTAVDAASVAKRLGAERVTMLYRRSRDEVSAYDHEINFVRNEGVDIRFLTQPVEFLGQDGRVTGVRCVKMSLGQPDASGRRRPEPVPGSQFVLPTDLVIKAIGQEKLVQLYDLVGVEHAGGHVKTDAQLRTSNPKVFAAGDCVRSTGQAITVQAAEDGKIVARAIAEQLGVAQPAEAATQGRFMHDTVNDFRRIHG